MLWLEPHMCARATSLQWMCIEGGHGVSEACETMTVIHVLWRTTRGAPQQWLLTAGLCVLYHLGF